MQRGGKREGGCQAQRGAAAIGVEEGKKGARPRSGGALHGPPCVAGGRQSVQTKWKVLASAPLSLLSGIKREMSQPGPSLHAYLRPLQSAQWCRNQGVYCKHQMEGKQWKSISDVWAPNEIRGRLEINLWPGDPRHTRGNAMQDSAAGFHVDPLRLEVGRDADAIFLHLSVSSSPPAHSPFPVPI